MGKHNMEQQERNQASEAEQAKELLTLESREILVVLLLRSFAVLVDTWDQVFQPIFRELRAMRWLVSQRVGHVVDLPLLTFVLPEGLRQQLAKTHHKSLPYKVVGGSLL